MTNPLMRQLNRKLVVAIKIIIDICNFYKKKFQADSYISLADYNALRPTDATLKRGDKVDLLKAGSSSWWYVKVHGKYQ